MDDVPVRVHIWVHGRVQGVGFRAFVADTAWNLFLRGWVRNVGWDKVETIAEGNSAGIEKFIRAVRTGPASSRIDSCQVEMETITGEFTEFQVRSSR